MSRSATAFVLGYHGCDTKTAKKLVTGKSQFIKSDKPYDWLGPGTYFWESDSIRAMEWAIQKSAGNPAYQPAVVGAVIDLGNCLDLLARADQDLLGYAHASLVKLHESAKQSLPVNENSKRGGDTDRRMRKLDCAVIRHLHDLVPELGLEPFDTVRGMFAEGEDVYPGSGFKCQSHVQIAVLSISCVRGIFYPPELGSADKTTPQER